MYSEDDLRAQAQRRAEAKAGFYIHFGIYVIVNIFLVIVWWLTAGVKGEFPWFVFPLLGWGIGIVAHFLAVYISGGGGFVDKMAENELRKLKEQQRNTQR